MGIETMSIGQQSIDNAELKEQALDKNNLTTKAEVLRPREEISLPPIPVVEGHPAGPDNDTSPVKLFPPDNLLGPDHQAIINERGLSVFSRHAPRHLKMPELLSTTAGAEHVVPPVMPVCVPTPVSCVRPRIVPDGTAPLNIVARSSQQPQPAAAEGTNHIAERLNDPSPTKTERYRKVASWAKDAAVAPPPVEGPQNDARDAALRRDEDRLAGEDILVSPPTPAPILRPLPSVRRKLPEVPPSKITVLENPPASMAAVDFNEVEQSMPGGPLPKDRHLESHLESHLFKSSTNQDDAILPMPTVEVAPAPVSVALDMISAKDVHQQASPGFDQQHRSQVEPILETPSVAQPGLTAGGAAKTNEDQSEILSKTNALLEMISSIQQKLDDLPSVNPKGCEQDAEEGRVEDTAGTALPDAVSSRGDPDLKGIDHGEQVSTRQRHDLTRSDSLVPA